MAAWLLLTTSGHNPPFISIAIGRSDVGFGESQLKRND